MSQPLRAIQERANCQNSLLRRDQQNHSSILKTAMQRSCCRTEGLRTTHVLRNCPSVSGAQANLSGRRGSRCSTKSRGCSIEICWDVGVWICRGKTPYSFDGAAGFIATQRRGRRRQWRRRCEMFLEQCSFGFDFALWARPFHSTAPSSIESVSAVRKLDWKEPLG